MEEETKPIDPKKYKFKELKVYASTEWLADNKKKYRQVFDRFDVTYIYAELSFVNKWFDKDFWEADFELKCFSLGKAKKELCNLNFRRKISKFENQVYVREGWGNKKEGSFWKKGTYCWEAWIDGEKVATRFFYIEDPGGPYDYEQNPYLELQSLRLYEGPFDDLQEHERVYFKAFNAEETRYIYAEVILKNRCLQPNWQCELFIKFHNEARELKGQLIRLVPVKKDDTTISVTAGWGSNVKGSWWEGNFTLEVVFMDELLGVMSFEVSDEFEEGIPMITLPHTNEPVLLSEVKEDHRSFKEVLSDLDRLIGLDEVKRKVNEHAQYIQYLNLRKEKGILEKDQIILHSVFFGNPGTGKTTVAQMMGMLYKKMGVLSKGHVYEADRAELVGEYIGQTAPKVKEVIEKARGGVLFIDEAYALARTHDDSKDFGREVIEILVKEMSNGAGDIAIIMAGYPKEMKYFIDSNPGMKSRIKLYYEFPDYLPQQLYKIAEFAALEKGLNFNTDSFEALKNIILNAYRNRGTTFGNARFVFDLVDKAKVNLGIRLISTGTASELDAAALSEVELQDVKNIQLEPLKIRPSIPVDQKLLDEAILELHGLIGIPQVKKDIHDLVQIVQYLQRSGKEVLNQFSLHTVFLGNPGTGKSTVARILAKIFKALGILERGHTVETDRQGLVAGYIGQSAIKTAEKIEEAIGGVLFIDEAYSLTQSHTGQGDYSSEVIQTLLKRMEDQRGLFFVFVAGYTEPMEHFLKSNPGLNSRFDRILKFEDYTTQELMDIAIKMFGDQKFELEDSAKGVLHSYLDELNRTKDKYFGNARTVRSIVQETIKLQNIRLSNLSVTELEGLDKNLITADDLRDLSQEADRRKAFDKPRLGFRTS
ncbi:MAG: AAA family ATPase [Saprospiraceae bacterium]|nr:AAA family ATPase [Saprospiraceae bacterium]MBK7811561.1 AAA family ATPase [Saprospiraceae bacterium]